MRKIFFLTGALIIATTAGPPKSALAQGTQIIENVLFAATNAPLAPCSNTGENAFGYDPPYNNVLFTDPQWGGVYQEMIRNVPGGSSDHNLYYWRNSFNANGSLMLGIQTPESSNGIAKPWMVALFDGNGCFLKPLYVAAGAPSDTPSLNWRTNWSRTDPNIFYTTGVSGPWLGIDHLSPDSIYAIHACAPTVTGINDPACVAGSAMVITPLYQFTLSNPTGANLISTDEPSGPSLSEDGTRIGIVTRSNGYFSSHYYWSSVGLSNSTTVLPGSLHTFDITANFPTGYCYSTGEVQNTRYIGNRFLVQAAGFRGSGSPSCPIGQTAAMQIIDDSSATPGQYGFIAQDLNAPWFSGGGHETWSPYVPSAPGGGYFVYNHTDGGTSYALSGCAVVSNVAKCTTAGGLLPAWPLGTTVIVEGNSVPRYEGRWTITALTSTSFSWNLGSGVNAGVGGKVSDGNQWEIHSIGLDGTDDVTNFEAVNQLSAQTAHSFWPWGSPLNGGTVTDFFYSGFAYNNVSQYPALSLSGCTYSGTAPTGIATCTLASGNVPNNWIVPANQQGSGTSTPYIYGVSDGSDQCYSGAFSITASTANTFSYQPLCAPAGAGTGGQVYLGATDEIYRCYRGDAIYGNGCVPVARTYTDQVTSDFYFQPLPNGTAEGDKVEFDTAINPPP
ncbi:MAG: hypothetical protein JO121_09050 [Deltaproteobacteria bacterium]|nr:hypothetical protein [Deltaproteobacteria bacterium]